MQNKLILMHLKYIKKQSVGLWKNSALCI